MIIDSHGALNNPLSMTHSISSKIEGTSDFSRWFCVYSST